MVPPFVRSLSIALATLALGACKKESSDDSDDSGDNRFAARSLSEARAGFETTLLRRDSEQFEAPAPPEGMFDLIEYASPVGDLQAYVGSDPGDGKTHPAIIWLVGGFSNSISELPWNPGTPDNDQSAWAFRKAGIVMMYPSLRGGNRNSGAKEGLYGEVDDVLAAAEHLAKLPYVDADRIYLGGHSVGGTLALLVAESSDRFRAVFSLGPTDSTAHYGGRYVPFDVTDPTEVKLRAPVEWLDSISTPTFVIEGARGNIDALRHIKGRNSNPQVSVLEIKNGTHFNIIRPACEVAAAKIVADTGAEASITIDAGEITPR